jgi:hypothetical protein
MVQHGGQGNIGAPALRTGFRELTGLIEKRLAAHPGSAQARALWLLDTVSTGYSRDGEPVTLPDLTLAECDACLADLHVSLHGTRLPCESRCSACGEPFEFAFDLGELRQRLGSERGEFTFREDGSVKAPSGRIFRLPCVRDLGAMASGGNKDWLRSFLVDGHFDATELESEISAAGPVLSQDITASCPECEATNRVRFDIAQYLVETIVGESAFLWREVHLIARGYGWGLEEILDLGRTVRRQLAGLIVSEASIRLRAAS